MGAVVVGRGELWWLETPDEKGRPVLVISRDEANSAMRRVMVAPVTRTLRSAPSQLPLGRDEGLPAESVANFDDLTSVPKALLVRRLGDLGPRFHELCQRLRAMADC
ncbi:MAG: type II toxin-antitoxin system PemK/MazF family toxin [Acidimicrobiales bacterium]